MNIHQFVIEFPQFAFDYGQPIGQQARIFALDVLEPLPAELEPNFAYRSGSRGRPNLNQARTHSQCATCKRVLRNDFFYTPPSMMRRNMIFSHCRECTQVANAERYATNAKMISARRVAIWLYLAPKCASCGFDQHISAMDMHHTGPKEAQVANLITELTLAPSITKVERLLRETSNCIPLCSNCHRMLHAGAIKLPTDVQRRSFNLADLLTALEACTAA